MKPGLRIALAATSILFLSCWSLTAHAEGSKYTVKTGYLTCHEASGWGFVFGSSRELKCSYSSNGGRVEYYSGSVSKFGADIGYLKSAVILWAVAAPTNDLKAGALAGHYGGVTASVTLGAGAGANVLIGGFEKSIALQPVSFEGQNGLNVAAGVAELSLKYRGEKEPR
ncbi:MAG TPA: DUF992 domain-containing protein [Candidatus Binataceae bacterium]|jgi:hypothetical protein|nr:DUF992 domain-containing protein [Candidatus Binataceae bacterium]